MHQMYKDASISLFRRGRPSETRHIGTTGEAHVGNFHKVAIKNVRRRGGPERHPENNTQ